MKSLTQKSILSFFSSAFLVCGNSIPSRSLKAFLETVWGALLSSNGFVTQSFLSSQKQRSHHAYFDWIKRGKWSFIALSIQMHQWIKESLNESSSRYIIDDTLIPRSSKKAPGAHIQRQHGSKPNTSTYLNAQNIVTIAMLARKQSESIALPLTAHLQDYTGNSNKLKTALALSKRFIKEPAILTMDSWYMKKPLLNDLPRHITVIGQVRKDIALHHKVPPHNGKRGAPRKYGLRVSKEEIFSLPVKQRSLSLYGKTQEVRYRSIIAYPRILNYRAAKLVYCEFLSSKGKYSSTRVIVSTNTSLSAETILKEYEYRWKIEPCFHHLKEQFGLDSCIQHSRTTFMRWVQIKLLAYNMTQVLSMKLEESSFQEKVKKIFRPWYKPKHITFGLLHDYLLKNYSHFQVSCSFNRKYRKIDFKEQTSQLTADEKAS